MIWFQLPLSEAIRPFGYGPPDRQPPLWCWWSPKVSSTRPTETTTAARPQPAGWRTGLLQWYYYVPLFQRPVYSQSVGQAAHLPTRAGWAALMLEQVGTICLSFLPPCCFSLHEPLLKLTTTLATVIVMESVSTVTSYPAIGVLPGPV